MHYRLPSEVTTRFLIRLIVALSLGVVSAGCASSGSSGARPEAGATTPDPPVVVQANELLRQGQPLAARDLYALVAAEPERDVEHGRALYNLARLLTDPANGLRDYRAAQAAFDRLLKDYPCDTWEADARAWKAVVTGLEAR